MFFLSFVLVLYLIVSVIRRLDDVDYLAKTLVVGGTVVAISALVEARTGFNVFNHLSRVIPFLHGGDAAAPSSSAPAPRGFASSPPRSIRSR